MRTFHTGGVAGLDITQGLPRVVELFEARKPKGLARSPRSRARSPTRGDRQGRQGDLTDDKGEEHLLQLPRPDQPVLVEKGQRVEPGVQLNEGSLYPAEILSIRGRTETESYIVAEVQRVYRAQGVDINDKHIELIVRQMLKKVRVESKGSTDLLPGQLEDRLAFNAINEKVKGKKTKTPARAEPVILGITKASLATGVLPLGRLLPGDDQGAHRRRPRGQAGPPHGPEGERDHREADPGRDWAEALPLASDRAGGAGPAARRGAALRGGARRRARIWPETARPRSSRASVPRSPRSSRSSRRRSSSRAPVRPRGRARARKTRSSGPPGPRWAGLG